MKKNLFIQLIQLNLKKLQKYEEKYSFRMGQKNKFFYLGKENNWKNLLNPEIEKKTREAFLKEIKELEYI